MQPVVFSLLASAYLFLTAGAAQPAEVSTIHEIGRTKYATVSIDVSTVRIDNDRDGGLIAAMMVRVKLNKPIKNTHTVDNATVFSCALKTATIVASRSYDAKNEVIDASETERTLPWVKGSDSAINIVMERLCKGQKEPLQRGVLEA